jgi:phage terminase large subunit
MFQKTRAYDKLLTLNKRIRGVCGGTSASKTISILLWLIDYCQTHSNKVVSVVSESMPHLKRGAIRDFVGIMETHGYMDYKQWNKTDYTYTFPKGTKLEFFSADQPGKVRGPRRDILFINEANNIPYETYDQLEVRTKDLIWLDWNPVSEFWWYTQVVPNQDVDFLTLTYLDNDGLDRKIIESIESRKSNKNWWKVYGLGQIGEVEGRIFTGWIDIDEVPEEARLKRYGLDFGYTNDPTAVVAVYKWNGGLVVEEVLYRKRMLNSSIAEFMKTQPEELIVADSAEPKSIDELAINGLDVIPSVKGAGSVLHGIQAIQNKTIYITKTSTALLKEYRGYLWMTDKNGKIINKPQDFDNHALDALRYAIADMYPIDEVEQVKEETRLPNTYHGHYAHSEDEDNTDLGDNVDYSENW